MDIEQDLGSLQQRPGPTPKGSGFINWFFKVILVGAGLTGLAIAAVTQYGVLRLYLHGYLVTTQVAAVHTRYVRVTGSSSYSSLHRSGTYRRGGSSHYEKLAAITFSWEKTPISKTVRVPMEFPLRAGQKVKALYLPGKRPDFHLLGTGASINWGFAATFGGVGLALFLIGLLWVPPAPLSGPARTRTAVFVMSLLVASWGISIWRAYERTVGGVHLLTASSLGLSMAVHENRDPNLTKPWLGPGVTMAPAPAGAAANRCPPIHLSSLSVVSGSPGDVIDLRGTWGTLTPHMVPFIYGRGDRVRLEILKWGPDDVRVQLPKGLAHGMHKVDVWCYGPGLHMGGPACAHDTSPRCVIPSYRPAGAMKFFVKG